MTDSFELPTLGNLDAKAEAAHFIAGIQEVVDGHIESVILEEFDGDITEVTTENAAEILSRRFDQDSFRSSDSLFGNRGKISG
jgi:hypothetical protein